MAYELAEAYVQIRPSTKGIQGDLETELGGAGEEAGKTAGSKFGSSFGSALKTVGKVAGAALVGAGTAMASFTKSSVEAGMAFDSSMSQVAATLGMTMSDLESEVGSVDTAWGNFNGNLREYAQFMGANTAFSATQAADALNYMALAGYNTQKSMDMLPNVLNLAAAGGMDLARASDMVTDASSALGLETEETTVMVDQMAKAASQSNTSVEQLGDAFLKIGATARNLKGGTQELSTVLGVLADNGIKGSEGGTHLRNILLSLQQAAENGAVSFGDFSVAVYDSDGNMRSTLDIIEDIKTGMGDMSQESKDAVMSGVFNKTDLASINALLGTSSQRFNELYSSIGDAAGAAQDMADTQLDNLNGDITLLKSAFEGLQIAISDGATPYIRDVVKGLTDVVDGIHDLVSGVDGAETKISKGFEGIVSGITDGLPVILDVFSGIIDGISGALPDLLTTISKQLPKLFDSVVGIMVKTMPKLAKDVLPAMINAGISMITELVSHISEIIMPIVQSLPEIVSLVTDGLIDNLPAIVSGLVELAGQIVVELPVILAQITVGIIKNLPSIFTGILDGVIDGVKGVFGAVGDWMTSEGAQELRDSASELAGALDEIVNSTSLVSKESANLTFAGQQEIAYYELLLGKLGEVVDENGNVKRGNEELVGYLLTDLANGLGVEMEYQDGVIKNWQTEQQEIQNLIEMKRMQMQLDAEAKQAAQAQESEAQLYDTLREAEQNLTDVKNQRISAQQELNGLMDHAGNWSILEAARALELQSTLKSLNSTEQELQATRDQATSEYQAAVATQSQYMSDLAAFTEGRYSDMSQSYQDFIFNVKSGAGEYGAALSESITDTELKLSTLIDQYESTGNEIYLSQIESAKLQLETLIGSNTDYRNQISSDAKTNAEEFKASGQMSAAGLAEGLASDMDQAASESEKMAQEVLDRANSVLGINSPSKAFMDIGGYTIEGLVNGMNAKQSAAISKIASIMSAVIATASNYAYVNQMYSVGANLGEGIAEGLSSRSSLIADTAASAVNRAVTAAKDAGKIESPSRIMREEVGEMLSAGLALGIEDGEGQILSAIDTQNKDMMNEYLSADILPGVIPGYNTADMQTAEAMYWARMMAAQTPQGTNYGPVTINVYGAEGQDVQLLAREVKRQMQFEMKREAAVNA